MIELPRANLAYTPADLTATIFHLMDVGPDEEFHDTQRRPYRIYRGEPIRSHF